MKTTFRQVITSQTICFSFSKSQASYLFFTYIGLYDQLSCISEVNKVEFDGHFGPHIWITFDHTEGKEAFRTALNAVKKTFVEVLRSHR